MTLDTPSIQRLRELEDQLSSLQQERDQLKQQIEADKTQAIQNVQPLLEKINNSLKLHGLSVVISGNLGIYLTHQHDLDNKFILCYVEYDELEKALNIIERHIKFIIAIDDKFPLYRHCSSFTLDLSHNLLKFTLLRSEDRKVHFTYDSGSETVSAYAITTYKRGCFVKSIGNVTLQICTTNLDTVNYTLKSQTYTETLDRIKNLYDQVVSDMSKAEAQLSF